MTANDSKSTPKKAEDATRHPLALSSPYLMDGESEQEMLMHRAWQEGHDAALRAQAEADRLELEGHWKAGFLRGAKFWYGKVEGGWTMWQSEQNECWEAAGQLWPTVRPESLEDARQVAQAQAGAGEEGDPQ